MSTPAISVETLRFAFLVFWSLLMVGFGFACGRISGERYHDRRRAETLTNRRRGR